MFFFATDGAYLVTIYIFHKEGFFLYVFTKLPNIIAFWKLFLKADFTLFLCDLWHISVISLSYVILENEL
jgi:hypothetical protein